jgi:hypothetical protein
MERGSVLAAYTAAWTQDSEDGIRQALAECWTETSTYVSPLTDVVHGIAGLTSLILDLPVMFPGASIGTTRQPDVHHDAACLSWRMNSSAPIRTMGRDYGLSLDGVDFVEFDDTGRIRRITAFFGLGPPTASPRPGDRPGAQLSRTVDLEAEPAPANPHLRLSRAGGPGHGPSPRR